MEPSAPKVDDFVNELECPLCLDILNEPFMYSKCGHNVCKNCCEEIHQLKEPLLYNKMQPSSKNIKCPVCRTDQRISDIVFNRTLSNITKALKKKDTPEGNSSTNSSSTDLEGKMAKSSLQETKSPSNQIGKLEIVVIQAKDLYPINSSGICDPYVEIFVNGTSVQKTKIVSSSLNPYWNEKFEVSLNPKTDKVYFRVFHAGHTRPILGEFGMPVHNLPFNEPVALEVPLYSSNTKGVLFIQVRALNYGIDPKATREQELPSAPTQPTREVNMRRESNAVERREEKSNIEEADSDTLTGSQIGDVVLGVGAVAAGIVGVGALALGSVAAVKNAQRRNSKDQNQDCLVM